jgi:hypothetical protein
MAQKEKRSKLELNACLMKLTEGWDEDAARAVVQAFCRLPTRSRDIVRRIDWYHRTSMRGHTDEMGDVNVPISGKEIKETIRGEKEGEAERIGYFKVYGAKDKRSVSSLITFEYFWEADLVTRSQEKPPNPFYELEYFTNTFEPYALLVFEWEEENMNLWQRIIHILKNPHLISWFMPVPLRLRPVVMKTWHAVPRALYGESKLNVSARQTFTFRLEN